MSNYYKRKICRFCNSKNIKTVLPLNKSPLCDVYIKNIEKQQFYDLNLCLCCDCNFAQLDTVVDPKIIYRDYIYVTSSSLGLSSHFLKFTQEVSKFLNFKKSKFIVDIGCNDGLLLNFFKKKKHTVLGVDPSLSAVADAKKKKVKTLNEFFDLSLAKKMLEKYGYVDLITINNIFANVDDLHNFAKGLQTILGKEGVIIIESSYLVDLMNNMVWDFIYHEHLSYFSVIPLSLFFKKFKIKLIRVQRLNTKGGSIRYYLARENSNWKVHSSVTKLIKLEKKFNISEKKFNSFNKKINLNKKKIINYLSMYKKFKIVGYGASATSTTLITHYKLYDMLDYLVDDNPSKINTFSPGHHIPVYELNRIVNDKPDIIIILAWRFKKIILKKLKIINYKNKIILPLPKFKIV